MKPETRHVKYAFADVVDFSVDRTIEAQVEIVAALNAAFMQGAESSDVIFLPTGDGICAGIIEPNAPADAHLQLALHVLKRMHEWTEKASRNLKCLLRFGINESVDTIITDINGRQNLAGAGINQAQRLMSIADGNQIVLGRTAFETLGIRDEYTDAFREIRAEVKHGQILTAYQFVQDGLPFLDTKVPQVVQRTDPIELSMTETLANPANFSTAAMVRCVRNATEQWEHEMDSVLAELTNSCSPKQAADLRKAQTAWEK